MTRLRQAFLATVSAVTLVGICAAPSIAQDQAPAAASSGPVEKVTVTGSRIKRPSYDSSLPTSSITSDQMERRQSLNVLDALLENRSTNVGASPSGAQAGFGAGSQFVALFGLGSNRTLTLLNGRRFVGGNQATLFGQANPGLQVDLNSIPTALIERIDIVSVGGAPSYGADAIGGVVNVILKDDFEGYQADGFYRVNEVGVGDAWRTRGVAGWNFNDDAGNLTIGVEHSIDEGFRYTDSPFEFVKSYGFFAPNPLNTSGTDGIPNNIFIPDRRVTALTNGGLITNPALGAGVGTLLRAVDRQLLRDRPGIDPILAINPGAGFFTRPATAAETALGTAARPITSVVVPLMFAPNGDLVPFNIGRIGADIPLTNTIASGGDALNLTDLTSLNSDLDRTVVTTMANYDVNEWMNVFFEGIYQKVTGVEVINQPSFQNNLFGNPMASAFPTGAYVAPAFFSGPITIASTNPFLSPQAQGVLAANGVTSFNIQRANVDINDDTKSINEGETYRVAAGAKGDFTVLDRLVTYDLGLVYGRAVGESVATTVLRREFALAIDTVRNAAGQIVCRSQTLPAGSVTWLDPAVSAVAQPVPQSVIDRCRPLNLFGEGAPSDDAQAFMRSDATSENRNDQYLGELTFTADLWELPAGTLSVAAGGAWRQERTIFEPSEAARLGLGRSAPLVQTKGRFTSEEYLFEFLLPIFGGENLSTRFMQEFTLEGNFRVMDNDRSGPADAGTWALTYRPFDWLKFRGNYTNSLRAPSLTELFLPASTTFASAADPCDSTLIDSGPNPATRRANCEAEWLARGYTTPLAGFISNVRLATVRGQTGGNANLVPETSTAFSYGFVLQPDWFLDDFALAVDYTKINVANAVSNLNLLAVMQQCYDASNATACPAGFVFGGAAGFNRGPDGQVPVTNAFNAGFINAGYLLYDGITASLDWKIGINHTAEWLGHPSQGDLGDLNVNASYQYYDNVETSISGIRNLDNNVQNTEIGLPEHSFTLNLLYTLGNVSALWQTQYQTEQQYNYANTNETQNIRFVDDYQIHNANLRWDITENIRAQVIVNNVFNTPPPTPIGPEAAAIGAYDLVGRSYTFSATTRF